MVLKQDKGELEALFLRGQAFYFLGEREAAVKYVHTLEERGKEGAEAVTEGREV